VDQVLKRYQCGPVRFAGESTALYERHLVFDFIDDPANAPARDRFEALARAVRDVLSQRWLKTTETYDRLNPKRVYYLSMEYLIGRSLQNNVSNMLMERQLQEVARREKIDLSAIAEAEPDAGLGNGGLGRLAACFIDSLATLEIPAIAYGLRYEYGMFRQEIRDGYQVELPDHWLSRPDPWEVARPEETVTVEMSSGMEIREGRLEPLAGQRTTLLGKPYDRPVVGYCGNTVNTLRLWGAGTPDDFDFALFNRGDWVGAQLHQLAAEALVRVLYPDDSTRAGQTLRFVQEYFLVACSLADILARFRKAGNDWHSLPDKVAIQLNDTHPSLAVAELMRVLVDVAGLGWEDAWDLARSTLAYTNHTLLPEALEEWPVSLFERLLPRHLHIIYEINKRFIEDVLRRYPGDWGRVGRMSLIEEGPTKQIRMAHLAVVGTHSTNGVAKIHSDLLRTRVLADFAQMYPRRFGNKTNGVTPRRWLLQANPALASLITDATGPEWVTDLMRLRALVPLADDAAFRDRFRQAMRAAKVRFVDWLKASQGLTVDPDSIFDVQVKRIHEYKRQLLNVLHIVMLYDRLRHDPGLKIAPRTFFFAGKAAPAYALAKLIIKLINSVATVIDADPATRGRLQVVFLPNYSVTLSERLIPASDISEQISTAGYEASGTGNMKFMMNGALTVGTRDGATIEMAEEAGEQNLFLFGLTAEQVAAARGKYNPMWHYEHEPAVRAALDLIFNDHFNRGEPGIFAPVRDVLLTKGDYYLHLADLTAYAETQAKAGALYRDPDAWTRKSIVNVAHSGKFSSDRSIREYAADIWDAKPIPVDRAENPQSKGGRP
jgi:starch phosphorylase